jgi:putative transposase
MTLEEMERWIVRYYFEHWANHPLKRLAHSLFTEGEGLGSTPAKRFLTLTVERGYPIPLPPSLDAWRSVVYEHLFKPLSRKSGIAYKNYEFKGDRLSYLIDRFGETEVRVLVDRDDFRVVYVVDRDGRTLIPLINMSTDEFTPAFSFDQAEAMLKAASDEDVDVKSAALRRDVLNRSMEVGTRGKGRRPASGQGAIVAKPAMSKQTTQRARQSEAVQRSANHPLPPLGLGVGQPALGTEEDEWDSAPALALFDRHTGASRP